MSYIKHGMSGTPEYRSWLDLRFRCRNPKAKCYHHYGGRGITVCGRWDDFGNFFDDMGPRPSPKHEIERIDNEGNYEPENCKWATRLEQLNNTRVNVKIDGISISEWSRRIGVPRETINYRIRKGLSPLAARNAYKH